MFANALSRVLWIILTGRLSERVAVTVVLQSPRSFSEPGIESTASSDLGQNKIIAHKQKRTPTNERGRRLRY